MAGIEALSNEQINFNIQRQRVWIKHYRISDPSSAGIDTAHQILNDLYKEQKIRGVKCPN